MAFGEKPCGTNSKGKKQVTKLKQDGQIQSTENHKENLLPSLLAALLAARQISVSFMSIKKAEEQISNAESVIKKLAKKGGTQEPCLIEDRQGIINTGLQEKSLRVCISSKKTSVQYVVTSQKLKEVFMSITAIKPAKCVAFCVMDAIRALAHYGKIWQCLPKQLVI